ncbi:hypothetical protein L226DRAFT_469189 [Lentinus tigrinus ALCF2SS1-7]|uniref:uncharacterized protein n=1 Tax=Lentinus tigrinus ALCF2SS1-7 TaxID=1328758 RepID=UPI001166346B|nr:hypothetical protein L226DRAFT_469189 [Lentinus tigrinus ALCF2SS1-7]
MQKWSNSSGLSRPLSPFDVDVAQNSLSWRTYIEPLLTRIAKKLYGSDADLPSMTSGTLGYLKLEGYSARDSTDNMCAFVDYVRARSWSEQTVDGFLGTLQIGSHWPSKLSLSIADDRLQYVWLLLEGLLAVLSFKDYTSPPPSTFPELVSTVFPPFPHNASVSRSWIAFILSFCRGVRPQPSFSFTARQLIEEDLVIEPTKNMIEHLKFDGKKTVQVFILDRDSARVLMDYHNNAASKAIGMGNLGNEILQSYHTLIGDDYQKIYELLISLGLFKIDHDAERNSAFDDMTIITGIIRLFHNSPNFDPQPRLLATRVNALQNELHRRRHWYNRLRRDIHRQKKEQPWMFWGAVLAAFFGFCTVVQTIVSVWALVLV